MPYESPNSLGKGDSRDLEGPRNVTPAFPMPGLLRAVAQFALERLGTYRPTSKSGGQRVGHYSVTELKILRHESIEFSSTEMKVQYEPRLALLYSVPERCEPTSLASLELPKVTEHPDLLKEYRNE